MQPLPREKLADVVEEVDRLASTRESAQTLDRATTEEALRQAVCPRSSSMRPSPGSPRASSRRRSSGGTSSSPRSPPLSWRSRSPSGSPSAVTSRRRDAVAAEHATGTRLTYDKDDAVDLGEVTRDAEKQLVFVATLVDVPAGADMHMQCTWRDPTGSKAHETSWESKATNKTTSCRAKIPPSSPPGTWTV